MKHQVTRTRDACSDLREQSDYIAQRRPASGLHFLEAAENTFTFFWQPTPNQASFVIFGNIGRKEYESGPLRALRIIWSSIAPFPVGSKSAA